MKTRLIHFLLRCLLGSPRRTSRLTAVIIPCGGLTLAEIGDAIDTHETTGEAVTVPISESLYVEMQTTSLHYLSRFDEIVIKLHSNHQH
jgi:hypothetical protein